MALLSVSFDGTSGMALGGIVHFLWLFFFQSFKYLARSRTSAEILVMNTSSLASW